MPGSTSSAPASALRAYTLATAFALPSVTLTDTAGQPYDLAARAKGRVTLLYLGYTNCTDTCPAVMATVRRGLEKVPAAVRGRVDVVFVTTDPARDTPAVLRRWLDRFDPHFVGLTGSQSALETVYRAVGMQPHVTTGHDGQEVVEHGADVYAAGTDGVVRAGYDTDTTPEDYAHDLPLLVSGARPKPAADEALRATGAAGRSGLVKAFSAFVSPVDTRHARLLVTLVTVDHAGDRLVGVDGPGGAGVLTRGGAPVDGVALPADAPVGIGAGGLVATFDTPRALHDGEVVDVTLRFRDTKPLRLSVPVVARG